MVGVVQSRGRGLKGILEVLDQILVETIIQDKQQTTDTKDQR